MMPQQRSLNLSNAVAVTAYEAWRQVGYAGGVSGAAHCGLEKGVALDAPRLQACPRL